MTSSVNVSLLIQAFFLIYSFMYSTVTMSFNKDAIKLFIFNHFFKNLTDKSCQFKYQYNNNLLCL